MQQQHLMQMQPMMAAYYPTNNVTTDHIQQYLDENKSLILKIVESQNSGKMAECAEHQAKLQRNLMYLAAIADSQPQVPTLHSQYPQGGMMQQPGGHYMQQQQAQQMSPQALMAARSSMMYGQQQYSLLQQQQAMHSQLLGMNSGVGTSMLQNDNSNAVASGTHLGGGFPDFGRKQDIGVSGGSSSGDGGETLYLKSPDKGN
ncbi:putative transcription factor SSXT family [Helianthus annuus]|nr:putative transcription factor SSXT family [Helianthus annuus]KAJ0557395.1 putative transcription factor SSXT family [Helianthus annuus]KAJ0728910.1 putative transcription factor SSXT family [Helianthus annuus]KAJ0905215.1 putative transcription factor SSXT family [Helianthus annuus]